MNTKQLSKQTGVTPQWLRALSKKALETGIDYIVVEDIKYHVKLLTTTKSRGKVYEYTIYEEIENQRKLAQLEASKLEAEQERLALADLFIPTPTRLTARDRLNIITNYGLSGKSVNEYVCWANDVYKDLKLTSRKLRLWQDKFAKGGIDALKDTRTGNNTKIDKKLLVEVIKSKTSAVKKTNLYELYRMKWRAKHKGKLNFDQNNCISSDAFGKAVNRMLAEDRHLKMLHTKGQDALLNEVHTTIRPKPDLPNLEWQIDGSPLDYMTTNDTTGKQERLNVVSIKDVCTGRTLFSLFDNTNSYSLVRALKKALNLWGKPKVILGDNGADYMSNHFQNALMQLGIRYQHHPPYRAKGKGAVERAFKTVFHSKLELLDNYIGHCVADRQLIEANAVSKDKRIGGDKSYIKTPFTSLEMMEIIDRYIENRLSNDLGWNQKYQAFVDDGFTPSYEDPKIIDWFIGKRVENKKVSRQGIVYNSITYMHRDLVLKNLLNQRVNISENIDNIQELYVFSLENEYLMTVTNRELLNISREEMKALEKESLKPLKAMVRESKKIAQDDQEHIEEYFDIKNIKKSIKKKKVESSMKKSRDEKDDEVDTPKVSKSSANELEALFKKQLQNREDLMA
jgi:transposase InsO family protein